jgi:N utilization substance protein B
MMKPRTRGRSIALQALYEIDQSNHSIDVILEDRLAEVEPVDEQIRRFIFELANGVLKLKDELDQELARYAPEWPVDQVAIIDRNILRIALWEMLFTEDTPIKVIINEAIELGKLYGSDSTSRFVNGVLGSLVENKNSIRQRFHITE